MRKVDRDSLQEVKLDEMMRMLGDAPTTEPSIEIRQNLQRIVAASSDHGRLHSHATVPFHWLRWAFVVIGCVAIFVASDLRHLAGPRHDPAESPGAPTLYGDRPYQAGLGTQAPVSAPHKVSSNARRAIKCPSQRNVPSMERNFTVQLPYSNPEIANGTGTTISVEMSREELMALGLSVGDANNDGKYLAEIALGDDGLPRSIRIPLPLKSLN